MDPRLRLHNAVVGLAHPSAPWPALLADAGYRLVRVEQPVRTDNGEFVADLIFLAEARSSFLVVECKEGSVQVRQATAYAAATPLDLIQGSAISVRDVERCIVDVAYAVWEPDVETTVASLAEVSPRFGVLEVGSTVRWHGAIPRDPVLAAAVAAPISADRRAIPRLLMVDGQSQPSDIVREMATAIDAAIAGGRDSKTVASLLEDFCWGWAWYARAARTTFEGQVARMLKDGAENELKGIISVQLAGRQSTHTVRFIAPEPGGDTQAGQLRARRAILDRLVTFAARVRNEPIPEAFGQLPLQIGEFVTDEADFETDTDESDEWPG